MAEGGVNNFVVTSWMGLLAPAATPRPIVDRVATEVDKILASPEIKKILAERGYETMGGGADKFAKYLETDIALWAKVVKASGATVN
jgi:tripartite-type tricarboxylate transporter receptor subunit TctC